MLINERLLKGLTLLANGIQEQAKKRSYEKMGANEKMTALKADLESLNLDGYIWVTELFDDAMIVSQETRDSDDGFKSKFLKVPYTISNGVVSFGSPIEVERITAYEPVADVEEGQEAPEPKAKIQYLELTQAEPMQLLLNDDVFTLQLNQEDIDQAKKDPARGLPFKNAVLTTFEMKNSQNQWYPKKVWEKNIPQLQDKASKNMLVGEADHPNGRPSIARNCIKFDQVWIEGNKVMGNGKILGNSLGRDIIAQALEGVPIALSTRGYGTVQFQEVNGERLAVIQDDFVCITIDAVWAPSAPGSYISGFEQSRVEEETVNSNEGDENPMNLFAQEVAKLRGMIEVLKAQGKDVSQAEAQLSTLEQVMAGKEAGMSEAEVMAILGPVKANLNPSGQFPADPDKGGVNDMTRWANQEQSQSQQQQQAASEQLPQPKELSAGQKAAREAAVQELTNGYDDNTKLIVQGLLEEYLTANEILTKFPEVQQHLHRVLGIVPSGGYINSGGVGMTDKEARYEKAPKNTEQAIKKLSEGLEDLVDPVSGRRVMTPDNTKLQFEQMVKNIANVCPHVMRGYLAAEQGRLTLDQGDTGVAADVAASYSALLPMIRQAWPKLFLPVIASIQTLDRPEGKIFYLKALTESEDELNKYHYYTYSDNVAEYGAAKRVKFKITSDTVSVTSKKLKTTLSYEEIQDARAYHNLDAFAEAIGIAASELAMEWNNQALYDLVHATSTSGNTDFGKTAPSTYTQLEWERYGLRTYLSKVSGDIFTNRQGEMTHILGGQSAILQVEKLGERYGFKAAQGDGANPIFSGVDIVGTVTSGWSVYKCQILETIAKDELICLRKGATFSDTPYVFAPYVTDLEPPRHGEDGDFSVTQGIMSRAARKVVSPKNIAKLTFKATTGTAL